MQSRKIITRDRGGGLKRQGTIICLLILKELFYNWQAFKGIKRMSLLIPRLALFNDLRRYYLNRKSSSYFYIKLADEFDF